MLDHRSYPVDPYVLCYKLQNVVSGCLPDNANMADEFEYFSRIGRGESRSPDTPDTEAKLTTQKEAMSTRAKEGVCRVRSDGQDATTNDANQLMRPRTNSMPSKSHNLRVRNFQTTGNKLENRGDTVKSTSHCSLASSGNSSEGHSDLDSRLASSNIEDTNEMLNTHRILLLGADGVGKTSLTHQFLTSDDLTGAEYLDDGEDKYCTVQLDGEESFLIFMDSDYDKTTYDPSLANAYIVVYSCTDRESFKEARGLLKNIRHFEKSKAIILCGNKSDLVRKRTVLPEEGKQLANDYGAKFTETSTMLNHKVDNLLVGILSQIKEQSLKGMKKHSKGTGFRKSVKGIVGKIVQRGSGKKSSSSAPST